MPAVEQTDSYVLVMFFEDEAISYVTRDDVVEEGALAVHDQCTVKCGGKEYVAEVLLCAW